MDNTLREFCSMSKSIVFLGLPGAGKGTQAKKLSEAQGYVHISTGEMLRAAVASKTALGNEVASIMDKGQLVPDDLMIDIIKERVAQDDCENGYILDGFPRTVAQAEALSAMMERSSEGISDVVFFDLPEEEVLNRLKSRQQIEGRSDDRDEVHTKRLAVYKEQTQPLINYYRDTGLLRTVEANASVDEVFDKLQHILDD